MIRVNDMSDEFRSETARLCSGSPIGAYIESYMNAYGGRRRGFVEFWLGDGCAFCRYYDTLMICGKCGEETLSFVNMLMPKKVLCAASCGFSSDEMKKSTGEIMRLTGESACCDKLPEGLTARSLTGEMRPLRDVYTLLCTAFDECSESGFESFFLDNSHKLRHGAAQMFCVYNEKNEPVSTLSAAAITDTAAVISAVAAREDYRGRGISSALLTRVSEQLKRGGREVFLMRNEPIGIYEKCGFTVCGQWETRKRSLRSLNE